MGDGLSVCQSRYFCLFSAALLAARDTPHVIAGCLLSLAKKERGSGVRACLCVCSHGCVWERNSSSCLESSFALSVHLESAFPWYSTSKNGRISVSCLVKSAPFCCYRNTHWGNQCYTACLLNDEIINTAETHMSQEDQFSLVIFKEKICFFYTMHNCRLYTSTSVAHAFMHLQSLWCRNKTHNCFHEFCKSDHSSRWGLTLKNHCLSYIFQLPLLIQSYMLVQPACCDMWDLARASEMAGL